MLTIFELNSLLFFLISEKKFHAKTIR
jgi:hypothetical protein